MFLERATGKRIYLKYQIFCKKGNISFSKDRLESSTLKSSVSFYLKREVVAGHSFFQTYWLLLENQAIHSFMQGDLFHVTVTAIQFFRVYMDR